MLHGHGPLPAYNSNSVAPPTAKKVEPVRRYGASWVAQRQHPELRLPACLRIYTPRIRGSTRHTLDHPDTLKVGRLRRPLSQQVPRISTAEI
jgi:hypothetical protein